MVPYIPSIVMLVAAVAMGMVFIWDVGGVATRMLEKTPTMFAWRDEPPPWVSRAFGVWCIVFGIGQLIFFIAT